MTFRSYYWTARRSSQSILKEISPGCSLEGLMLKLKLQYFGHLMRRVDSLEKTLMLGSIGRQEEKGTTEDEMAGWPHQLNGREFEWTPGVGDGQGGLACCDSWGHKELDTTERLKWTELNWTDPPKHKSKLTPLVKLAGKLQIFHFIRTLCKLDVSYHQISNKSLLFRIIIWKCSRIVHAHLPRTWHPVYNASSLLFLTVTQLHSKKPRYNRSIKIDCSQAGRPGANR